MMELNLPQALQLAMQRQQAGQLVEAEQLCRQILLAQPNQPDTLHLLGVVMGQLGQVELAVDLIRRAIALSPDNPLCHWNLARLLQSQGQLDQAIACYRRTVELKPDFAEAHNGMGAVLRKTGKVDEAIACYERAVALRPDYAEAQNNLANAFLDKGWVDQAIACFQRALALKPDYPDAYNNLGVAWRRKGELDQAVVCLRRAIGLKGDYADAYNNLGNALQDRGELDEAIACRRKALELNPCFVAARDNLIFAMHYHPDCDSPALLGESRRWNQMHAKPLEQFIQPFHNDASPERRLRIGYVSADFRAHASMLFISPLFRNHDRARFEITAYSSGAKRDSITDKCRTSVDHWREIKGMSDEQSAEQIRRDGIDILMDLKLHTDNNRLPLFARKPAPVQITWLGYPGTTGLDAVDYRLSDPYLDPPGEDETVYSERTIRLPHTFWCYDPEGMGAGSEIAVGSLPALGAGRITFGCLNTFCKMNDSVLRLWARVLCAVGGARLILLSPRGQARQRVARLLAGEGIDPSRVEFVDRQSRTEYLHTYNRIDVGLDTFPYNGHTTSLDSLWMGVPVVTLIGKTAVGRAGWSQLSNLGLGELAASRNQDFVQVAVGLAGDLDRLSHLRATLRERMRQSPLMDGERFARDVELVYVQVWRQWSQGRAKDRI